MATDTRIVTLSIDGLWMPMDFARLMHLVVRFYRLEQLVWLAESGRRNLFDDRLDAVVLKYLAAFDWIAAPLMSGRFNDSFAESEAFVRDLGLTDLRVVGLRYGPKGHVAFRGLDTVMDRLHWTLAEVIALHAENSAIARDAQGKLAALEVIYARNLKMKGRMMQDAGYSAAELNAIVAPSLEDLHFISNAVAQGRIGTVEIGAATR